MSNGRERNIKLASLLDTNGARGYHSITENAERLRQRVLSHRYAGSTRGYTKMIEAQVRLLLERHA